MKNRKKYVISIVLFFLLFILTYAFIFKSTSFTSFFAALKYTKKIDLVFSVLCCLLYFLFGSLYIKKAFKELGIKTSILASLKYQCAEYYFSGITPSSTGGQPVSLYLMGKDEISIAKGTIILILNTILYKIAILLLGILALLIETKVFILQGFWYKFFFFLGWICNCLFVTFLFLVLFSKKKIRSFLFWGLERLEKWHILKHSENQKEKLDHFLKDYQESAIFFKEHKKTTIRLFLLLLLQRLSMLSISYFIYLAFGLNTYSYFAILSLQIGIALGLDSVPLPGGIGAGEGLTYSVNTYLYGNFLCMEAMILLRGLNFYLGLFLSLGVLFIYLIKIGLAKRSKKRC